MRWVKTCHHGHDNEEDAERCRTCGESLFDIQSRGVADPPAPVTPDPAGSAAAAAPATPGADRWELPAEPPPSPIHPAQAAGSTTLYLEHLDTGMRLTIASGQILGREDPELPHDPARVTVPERWRGANFVSRQHCQFDCLDGRWYVTPLHRGSSLAMPNPTFINREQAPVDDPYPLNDGDRLFLAELGFVVRIEG